MARNSSWSICLIHIGVGSSRRRRGRSGDICTARINRTAYCQGDAISHTAVVGGGVASGGEDGVWQISLPLLRSSPM